jgi:hypothetical protein
MMDKSAHPGRLGQGQAHKIRYMLLENLCNQITLREQCYLSYVDLRSTCESWWSGETRFQERKAKFISTSKQIPTEARELSFHSRSSFYTRFPTTVPRKPRDILHVPGYECNVAIAYSASTCPDQDYSPSKFHHLQVLSSQRGNGIYSRVVTD